MPLMVLRLALVALLLLSTPAAVLGEDEMQGEAVEHQQQDEPAEAQDMPQEEAAPVPEEPQEPPQEEEKEATPVQEEPVQEEELVIEEEDDDAFDDSLFNVKVFECVAPKGDPAPPRKGPMLAGSILTLCYRPLTGNRATLKKVEKLDFAIPGGPTHTSIRDNESVEPLTRVVCPFKEDTHLCITATKLGDMFFAKASDAAAEGEMLVEVDGEERTVGFRYDFTTAESKPQAPIEHDYHEMPATPPSFPCGKEVRIWMIMALLLTLLEFAFSPSSSSSDSAGDSSGKKKKTKVTKVA